jgi:ATP-dependent DNA helicase RecG
MRCSELFDQLNELDEHPRIEAKTAHEVSTSVMETICAYANEPGLSGGFLLLASMNARSPGIESTAS